MDDKAKTIQHFSYWWHAGGLECKSCRSVFTEVTFYSSIFENFLQLKLLKQNILETKIPIKVSTEEGGWTILQ